MSPVADISSVQAREIINARLRYQFAKEFIEPNIKEAANDETAEGFLPNHDFLIADPSPALLTVKGRKEAHSWGISAKSFSRCAVEPRSTTIIGSYDEDEAREKLNFLDWIYKAASDKHPALLRELKMSDGSEVRKFANGSRIRFIARKSPTGPGAAIEWDEFSVEKQGQVTAGEILVGAIGCTTHTGTISLGGTQRGPDTMFNKIATGRDRDAIANNPAFAGLRLPTWKVGYFPWWTCPALCNNVREAAGTAWDWKNNRLHLGVIGKGGAWDMLTADRVRKYGNSKLLSQYVLYCTTPELGEEMFKREFEMFILDDKESYYEMALLNFCYKLYDGHEFYHCEAEGAKYGLYGDALKQPKLLVDQLASDIRNRRLIGDWGWAMDIGRDNDRDDIWIGQIPRGDPKMLRPRLSIGMDNMPFDGKEDIVHYLLKNLPITRGSFDATRGGLGVNMGENLHKRYGQRVIPFQFTMATKQILASGLKGRMQAGKLALPPATKKFQKLENQILKVKKVITPTGNVLFDVERNKGFHGDCFWSLAMLSEITTASGTWVPRRGAAGSYKRG